MASDKLKIPKPKFSIGASVFYLKDNSVCEGQVTGISLMPGDTYHYRVGAPQSWNINDGRWVDDSRMYSTRKGLADAVINGAFDKK